MSATHPLAILSTGMVTGVGLSAPATCAAIRCGITGFVETGFMFDGEWLIGSPVPLDDAWRGREKLLRMAVPAIKEAIADIGDTPLHEIPLLLCVAEEDRPGRFAGLDAHFLQEVQVRAGVQFHHSSKLIPEGRLAGITALEEARSLLTAGHPCCLIAGVDTLLVGQTLDSLHTQQRLLTADNSDGFLPGEAAAAVLIGHANQGETLTCLGLGHGTEPAPLDSEEPLRADGLVAAIKSVLTDADLGYDHLDFRITDISGEQYGFKEAALALSRTLRVRKEEFDIWHPADCIGEVGAAIVPITLGVALAATQKSYAPGPGILCHFSANGPDRAALILRTQPRGAA